MKNLTVILLTLAFTLSCSSRGKILLQTDTFKNAQIATLELKQKSDKRPGIFYEKYYLVTRYTKEITDKKTSPVEVTFYLGGFPGNPGMLKREAIFKIDDKNRKVELRNIKRKIDSVVGQTNKYTGFTYSTVWKSFNASIILPDDIKGEIISCKDMMLRFYAGNKSLTFKVKKKHLGKVKEFLRFERNVDEKLKAVQ